MSRPPPTPEEFEIHVLREAIRGLLEALSPLHVCGHPIHTLDTALAGAIRRAVLAIGEEEK